MPVEHKKAVVIDPERVVQTGLKNPNHFVFRIEVAARDKERDAFLVLRSNTLNKFADSLIAESQALGNLRVVFVLMENGASADRFFDRVQELNTPEIVSKLFRVTKIDEINRVLHAWCEKTERLMIASAYVDGDDLVVQACDLERYRINFKDFVGLSDLPDEGRANFTIDEIGDRLSWPAHNVSIDLDVIRYKVDSAFRTAKDMNALADYKEYLGQAIRSLMSRHKLTKSTVAARGGPTERHLLRIEQGAVVTYTTLEKLSKAHRTSTECYIQELIEECDILVEAAAEESLED